MGNQFNINPVSVAALNAIVTIYLADQDSTVQFKPATFHNPLRLRVQNNLVAPGRFSIDVAPQDLEKVLNNFNFGTSPKYSTNSITSLITPMSVISIILSRGDQEYPVFMGVITKVREQFHRQHSKVSRIIQIEGEDFLYYMTHFAYFTLSWLGATGNILDQLGNVAGTIMIQKAGGMTGSPAFMGTTFFESVVLPYLRNTSLPTGAGFKTYDQLVNPIFGDFSTGDSATTLAFPFLTNFYLSDGTWWDKFSTFFTKGLYELYSQTILAKPKVSVTIPSTPVIGNQQGNLNSTVINTAKPSGESNDFPNASNLNLPDVPTKTLTLTGVNGTYEIGNCFIARQLPFPQLRISSNAITNTLNGAVSGILINQPSLSVYTDGWDALGEYVFDPSNPIIDADIQFDSDLAKSFYVINPTQLSNMLGGQGNNAVSQLFILSIGTLFDPVAFTKYGYRPEILSTEWLSVVRGPNATSVTTDVISQLMISILLTFSSIYVPMPLMARGALKIPLSPTILVGNKITCYPFKDTREAWTFYIEEVTHTCEFGGENYTLLTVDRGLPYTLYNDSNFLKYLLCGLVERVNNSYTYPIKTNPILSEINGLSMVVPGNAKLVADTILAPLITGQPQAK